MLINNMSLRQMLEFMPSDEDMAVLPLDVTVYGKITVISSSKENNVDFMRFFFTHEECKRLFKDVEKTVFYDFDATNVSNSKKFITLFDVYAFDNINSLVIALQLFLEEFTGEADVFLDFFTHDDKLVKLSLSEGHLEAQPIQSRK